MMFHLLLIEELGTCEPVLLWYGRNTVSEEEADFKGCNSRV